MRVAIVGNDDITDEDSGGHEYCGRDYIHILYLHLFPLFLHTFLLFAFCSIFYYHIKSRDDLEHLKLQI